MKSQITRKQHFVPRFYLAQWENAGGKVTVHNLVDDTTNEKSAKSILWEEYYYEQDAAAPDNRVEEANSSPTNAASWGQLFQGQVERCWKKPYGGDKESQKLEAAFAVRLTRDGRLEGKPVPERTPASPYLRSYQDSALQAIIECQPYKLPAVYYDEWKYFAPVFTERVSSK